MEVSSPSHHMQLDLDSMCPSLSREQLISIVHFSPFFIIICDFGNNLVIRINDEMTIIKAWVFELLGKLDVIEKCGSTLDAFKWINCLMGVNKVCDAICICWELAKNEGCCKSIKKYYAWQGQLDQ